jgi:asparagine N-glycosylation enzyme membrane subunit Stt3
MLVERERIGARILSTLVIGTLAMALVVAALVLDLPTLGMGTAMTFGVVVFVGLPTWAAVVGDAVPQGRR